MSVDFNIDKKKDDIKNKNISHFHSGESEAISSDYI